MKMISYYLMALLLSLLMVSCGDDEPDDGGNSSSNKNYVDLGLPSGTLWATCNVGASRPEDYGNYFAWGETSPKDTYEWSTYKWSDGDFAGYDFNKYNTDDDKAVLDLSDDAAYINWGPKWRMPSVNQWIELQDECDWQWTTINGIDGYLVKSNYNKNSLFLPAAGIHRDGSLVEDAGSRGYYWSRELQNDRYPAFAYHLYFKSGVVDCDYDIYSRHYGLSVRAVHVP